MSVNRREVLATVSALALGGTWSRAAFAENPRRGGVLTTQLNGEQRVLNPAIRASTGVYIMTSKIMEALVDLDAAGQPSPVLATSWDATPDGKTITFKLREGVTWHDGKPFTSADVQFTAMEMWKKYLNYGTQLQQYLEAVDTPDANTAVFRYSRPMPLDLLLRALCDLGYIAPRHVFEGTNILENPANTAPIGTGPFKFVQYERGQFVIAERNPNYWRKEFPYLDRIVWRFITDKAAATAALETGQVQTSEYNALSLADLDRLKSDKRFTVSNRGLEANAFNNTLEFNSRRPGRSRPPRPPSIRAASRPTSSTPRKPPRYWTRPGTRRGPAAPGSRSSWCRSRTARTCRCSPPSSSNRCRMSASRSRS
jgi:peptide/nickel transport system substrate-binding protein